MSSACIPCRRRKSKCDGALPSCSTCTAVYRTECYYDADSDHRRKAALKRDIQSLQQQNDALDVIVASLRSLPEAEAVILLHSLRGDSSIDLVAASLRADVRLPHSYALQTLEADLTLSRSATSTTSFENGTYASMRSQDQSSDDSQALSGDATPGDTPAVWFRTPQDAELVEHLMNLYFAWIHPFYHFFSQDQFLHDMGRGRTNFCSAMLVSALLAYACHYSDRPQARTDPNNPNTAGDHFFAEAKRILDRDQTSCLTTVQALGIMALRECSHGRDGNGYKYAGMCVRMALELGLHLSVVGSGLRSADVEARKITFWAAFNLETICSVGFGRLSQLPRAAADIQKPSANDRSESLPWEPYVDTNFMLSPTVEQPARPMLFIDQLSQLSELSSDMVNTFYAPQERLTSRGLAATYAQYQEWYQKLPAAFCLQNGPLPHVLVLHMYYYACVLHLFRPYIKLDLRGAGLYPRDTCTFCANEISSLVNVLRNIYGLRRVPLAVTWLLLSASTIHLLNLPSESASTHLCQGMHDLQAISVNHQFAAKCVDIVRALAAKWNIPLPEGAAAASTFKEHWPSPPSSTFFAASIPRNSSSGSDTRSGGSESNQDPFPPPEQTSTQLRQQRQRQQQFPTYYSDTTTPMDANQTQMAFWTPFPAQGVPTQQQHWHAGLTINYAQPDSRHQWSMYGGCTGPTTSGAGTHQGAVGSMDEDMGGSAADWSWH